jgi:hypothetical protein
MKPQVPVPDLIKQISELSNEFHGAGVLAKEVILEIYRLTGGRIRHSTETGSGKSTLLFSAISERHTCFTLGTKHNADAKSLSAVQQSPFFNAGNVEFILGPSQRTLPCHTFEHPLQLVFIDGPHGYPFPELEYYFLYPHLEEGGWLILDDIHIPTIARLHDFLKEEAMFEHTGDLKTTAFFRRTSAPLFDPYGDGWWLQNYNKKRFEELHYLHSTFKHKIYLNLVKVFGEQFAEKVRLAYRGSTKQ